MSELDIGVIYVLMLISIVIYIYSLIRNKKTVSKNIINISRQSRLNGNLDELCYWMKWITEHDANITYVDLQHRLNEIIKSNPIPEVDDENQ